MAKKSPGLQKRGRLWWIDKRIKGFGRLCESCGTDRLSEAEQYLARRQEEIRNALVYGIRPTRTFAQAATKYLEENQHKRSIQRDVYALQAVMPFIGQLPLERIHNDSLAPLKQARLKAGKTAGTVNKELATVRRILNLAARVWRHENGMTWLVTAPLIEMVKGRARSPYPMSWEEQGTLFQALPPHLARMALFKVNTGCREQEVCQLRWQWEVKVPEIDDSVFIIPDWRAKNGQERIVVLNRVARSVVEQLRRDHPEYVFTYRAKPIRRMLTSAWKRAREKTGLSQVRVHDLKHTFGHRLRAAGVSLEDRQDLLGHKSERITTHYSAPDISRLIEAANKACERRPTTVLRVALGQGHAKLTQRVEPSAR